MARLFAGVAFLAYGWALFGATCLGELLPTVVTSLFGWCPLGGCLFVAIPGIGIVLNPVGMMWGG